MYSDCLTARPISGIHGQEGILKLSGKNVGQAVHLAGEHSNT